MAHKNRAPQPVVSKASRQELRKLAFNISSLADLSEEITNAKNLQRCMKSVLYMLLGTLSSLSGAILRHEPETRELLPLAHKGLSQGPLPPIKLAVRLARQLGKIKTPLEVKRPPANFNKFFSRGNNGVFAAYRAKYFLPLTIQGKLIGALITGEKLSGMAYSPQDFEIMFIMANSVAVGLHNHLIFSSLEEKISTIEQLYKNMRQMYYDTVEAFAVAIDSKDAYTKDHSLRVAKYAVAIAQELKLPENEIEGIHIAALLHDIGKVSVDKTILNKAARLTEEERQQILRHPAIGAEIMAKINFPWTNVTKIIRHHHERPDKNGYPDGLSAEQIDRAIKIISLVDAFDAMTHERPYRKRLSLEDTLKEIFACLGQQFDSEVANVLFRILKRDINNQRKQARIISHLDTSYNLEQVNKLLNAFIQKLS